MVWPLLVYEQNAHNARLCSNNSNFYLFFAIIFVHLKNVQLMALKNAFKHEFSTGERQMNKYTHSLSQQTKLWRTRQMRTFESCLCVCVCVFAH